MKLLRNITALIKGNIKCVIIKIFNISGFSYSPYIRLNSNVSLRIGRNSKMFLGKGLLVDPRSVLSVSDGGTLLIGDMVGINCNSCIMCHEYVYIGKNTIMGPGVYIYDHDHEFSIEEGVRRNSYKTSPVTIGENCWIGAGSIILRGTTLGNNCLVAAGSILKGSYPDGSVIIQKRETLTKS